MVDLHTHTTASDGMLSPDELVMKAFDDGITHLAVTDHDTVAGIQSAAESAEDLGIELIPGIEISARFREGEVHILGLGIDYRNRALLDFIEEMQVNRKTRNLAILENAAEKGLIKGKPEKLLEERNITGRPHIAALLVENGSAAGIQNAFEKYLGFNRELYTPRKLKSPEDVFALIRECRGIPVIAHPNTLMIDNDLDINSLTDIFRSWKKSGLEGIEVFHPNIRPAFSRQLRKAANDLYLFTSGGSDFHNPDYLQKRKLGRWHKNRRVPIGIIEKLKSRLEHQSTAG